MNRMWCWWTEEYEEPYEFLGSLNMLMHYGTKSNLLYLLSLHPYIVVESKGSQKPSASATEREDALDGFLTS